MFVDPWDLPNNLQTPHEIKEKHYDKQKDGDLTRQIVTFTTEIQSTIMMKLNHLIGLGNTGWR